MYLLHHLLDQNTARGEHVALVDGKRSLTYAAFQLAVAATAARLQDAGLQRGDRVAICLPKSLEECVAIFAISRAGGVFVPVNASLKPAQVQHIISDCGARLLITHAQQFTDIAPLLPDVAMVAV